MDILAVCVRDLQSEIAKSFFRPIKPVKRTLASARKSTSNLMSTLSMFESTIVQFWWDNRSYAQLNQCALTEFCRFRRTALHFFPLQLRYESYCGQRCPLVVQRLKEWKTIENVQVFILRTAE